MKVSDGAPEEIRTPDPQIRSLVLYGCVPFRSFPVAWRSSKTSSFRMQAISLRNCHFSAAIHVSN